LWAQSRPLDAIDQALSTATRIHHNRWVGDTQVWKRRPDRLGDVSARNNCAPAWHAGTRMTETPYAMCCAIPAAASWPMQSVPFGSKLTGGKIFAALLARSSGRNWWDFDQTAIHKNFLGRLDKK
jgi:hypothetical protein